MVGSSGLVAQLTTFFARRLPLGPFFFRFFLVLQL
jgi:hypothetical protein